MVGPQPEAVPFLVEAIKDAGALKPPQLNYRYPRASAALVLGLMGAEAKEAVPTLMKMLQGELAGPTGNKGPTSWEDHRAAAAFALGEIGTDAKDAAPAATRALKDSSPTVRRFALRALAKIAPDAEATTAALREALGDSDKDVRRAAEQALKAISEPPEETVTALLKALSSDAGHKTRDSLRDGLRALAGSEAAWKPVSKGAGKQRLPVHESVALAAGYLDSLAHMPSAEEINRQQDQYTEETIHFFLALGGIQQGVSPSLLEALGDEDRAARRSAAKALGRIGEPGDEAVSSLKKALSDDDWIVRCAASDALRRIER